MPSKKRCKIGELVMSFLTSYCMFPIRKNMNLLLRMNCCCNIHPLEMQKYESGRSVSKFVCFESGLFVCLSRSSIIRNKQKSTNLAGPEPNSYVLQRGPSVCLSRLSVIHNKPKSTNSAGFSLISYVFECCLFVFLSHLSVIRNKPKNTNLAGPSLDSYVLECDQFVCPSRLSVIR